MTSSKHCQRFIFRPADDELPAAAGDAAAVHEAQGQHREGSPGLHEHRGSGELLNRVVSGLMLVFLQRHSAATLLCS